MDPLSLATSVASLASLALDVSCTVGSYCKAVKDARKDVQEIARELASMQDLLHQLEDLLQSQQLESKYFDSNSVLVSALDLCGNSIQSISDKVQTLELNWLARTWEKLKWPFNEKDMLKTLATLRRCAATFQFALTIEGCNLLSRSSEDATKSLRIQLETAEKVLELTRNVGTMAESAKEALKVSTQVSEIIRLVSDHRTTVHAVHALSHGVGALAIRSQEHREMEILSWLSSHQYSRIHHDICARRMAGTGQWLLEHREFEAWIHQSNPMLWCTGGPGVGKSVLTSLVVDHMFENEVSINDAIAYFHFDYRNQEVQTPAFVLASLFRQLAARRKPFPQALLDFYNRYKEDQAQDLMSELCEAFRVTCETYNRCFIIIDALDECKHQGHRKEFVRVLKGLSTSKTKIFVTSRPHTDDIKHYFEDALRIDVEASEADIRQYCSRMIEESASATELMDDLLRQQVVNSIASKARGMFLLPVLQMQSILEAMTRSEIKASLSNLSASLGQAFENTIRRIDNGPPNRRQAASQALMWVSHARRPLQVRELCHALATKLGDTELDQDSLLPPRSIVESCLGLIVVDDESSTVRLVHYTLQDYLQSRQPQRFLQEETYITQVLITYLCLDEAGDTNTEPNLMEQNPFGFDERLLIQFSFLEYAATNWGHHAKLAQPSEINELGLAFLNNTPKMIRATQSQTLHLNYDMEPGQSLESRQSRYRRNKTGLHIAAGFGLVELLGSLLDRGVKINVRDSHRNTALHDAAMHGQINALKFLLERGADVNVRNVDHNSPLYLAVSFSNEQLIPILLKQGAILDDRCKDDWSPLHKAADNGHITIAQMLLDHGASVFVWTMRGLIPLHRAAGRGHVQMVRLLLRHGSPVDMITSDGWTPLHGASSSGQAEVVKVLLDHNAEINKQSSDKRTALHRACRGDHYDVVFTLLMKNAKLWVRDSGGNLPLHRAAKGGDERISRLLLQDKTVSPLGQLSALNLHGHTPEMEASSAGHWKVAALLRQEESMRKGTNVEQRNDLERAIEEGHLTRVKELLKNGADVSKSSSDSSTPLHQALLLENEPIAQVLLEYDANVTAVTSNGWQPLHCAASKGMTTMVRQCLDRKADIAARTLDGQTALHKSCRSGNVETVKVLLDSGADIEAQDNSGWRPLHTASAAGFQDVVELLIASNADLQARGKNLCTVQACAAMAGKHALVEYLRQARNDIAEVIKHRSEHIYNDTDVRYMNGR